MTLSSRAARSAAALLLASGALLASAPAAAAGEPCPTPETCPPCPPDICPPEPPCTPENCPPPPTHGGRDLLGIGSILQALLNRLGLITHECPVWKPQC
ncbi:hypothetical protein ADK35_39280 [Streptomyces viridochromogenes]|nr:hypothetical protein ADK35_39280 [Streptomyces viridochromogenes]KOG10160.1 hypothetical protein ADK36_39465 [Streptomyces viridochromogenes]